MVHRPSILLRVLAVLLALVQSASPAMAAVGDGVLAGRGGGRPIVAHVEDRQQADCPAVHAADCALCACLSLTAEGASCGQPFVPAVARAADPPVPAVPGVPTLRAPHAARAPPVC